MENLTYLHLEAIRQESQPLSQTQEAVGASWKKEAWNEIFEDEEPEEENE